MKVKVSNKKEKESTLSLFYNLGKSMNEFNNCKYLWRSYNKSTAKFIIEELYKSKVFKKWLILGKLSF